MESGALGVFRGGHEFGYGGGQRPDEALQVAGGGGTCGGHTVFVECSLSLIGALGHEEKERVTRGCGAHMLWQMKRFSPQLVAVWVSSQPPPLRCLQQDGIAVTELAIH